MAHSFDAHRQAILGDLAAHRDRSLKAAIDAPLERLLSFLNAHPDWVSTSSCSGRLLTFLCPSPAARPARPPKSGGHWLFVSHSPLCPAVLARPVEALFAGRPAFPRAEGASGWDPALSAASVVRLLYQPPLLHLEARSVAVAAPVLRAVVAAGFRNSGLSLSHQGRVILAVRASTGGLDVPIATAPAFSSEDSSEGPVHLLVDHAYLGELVLEGHRLMQLNQQKLERLSAALFECLGANNAPLPGIGWEPLQDRKRRMKREGLALRAAKSDRSSHPEQEPDSTHSSPGGENLEAEFENLFN